MPINSDSPIYNLAEAAKYLQLSIDSVRKYVQRGRLKPSATVGRAYLFTQDTCDKFRPTIRPPGNPNFKAGNKKRRPKK